MLMNVSLTKSTHGFVFSYKNKIIQKLGARSQTLKSGRTIPRKSYFMSKKKKKKKKKKKCKYFLAHSLVAYRGLSAL